MSYFLSHLPQIGAMTLQHIALVAGGLAIALIIAVPLGVYAARRPRAGTAIFAAAGIVYVIPSLALLAVAVRYLGLGALPVVLVLAAYAQFVLVRNVAAALANVPRAQLDAADGLGFTRAQRFWRIEVPLATPVMLGGIRLAAVALIAIATLGGYVGAGGLGNEIFLGLQRKYVEQTMAGSIPAAALAVIADWLLRGLERSSRSRWA
ncbi:MAG TPA: ABC transporter permease [Candidatus Baltobacteraceae bacterium]|nr:ABC transporter permease [Candidatus Baltobacteraceae bacterium]